nr:unnamed protein product [Digitaria exilis]
MMSPFLVAFFLLCLGLINLPGFCVAGNESYTFSGFATGAGNNLTLDGTAIVTGEGLLELTNKNANVQGHAFLPTPVQFKDSPNGTVQSFSLTFVFAIISTYSDASSDGMAFVIAPGIDFSNVSPSQYLGLVKLNSNDSAPTMSSSNNYVAVELDTIKNEEFNDIDNNHVGIDINTLSSVQSSTASFYDDKEGGMFKSLSLRSGQAMQVWVDYDGKAKQINVTLAPMGWDKPSKPLLSNISDLSAVLTDKAYVGFSAATGPIVLVIVRRHLAYAELREDWEVEFGPHRFSYKELFNATEGFKSKHLLGVGGFGKVYKGVLPRSKSEVAVKRVSHDSSQGIKEFVSEVVSIGHLRHRNLVHLLGYCRRKGELLLVYDYMPNGSLDKYLYGEENKPLLEWSQRFQIIKDVASGLFYLHEKWEQVVIHRDIKASNVLLDGGMIAHLGDFGLARLYDHGTDLQTTHVVGTMGYIAPELSRTGKASPLTDVFAFGTFLLEVTCGRRPVSNSVQHGRAMLVDRVLEYWHRGALEETVDHRLRGNYNIEEARMVLTLGLMCSHPFPGERPTMRQVMQYLDGDVPLPELTPASMSLLSLMQNQLSSLDQCILQYPWSANSIVR